MKQRRDGWVAESTGLLNLRVGNCSEGSNSSLSAIFFAPIRIFKSESVCAAAAKTRWHKGFYNILSRVLKTHSDSRISPFFRKNPPFSVWILTIPGKPQKLEWLHNSFIISNNAFCILPSQVEDKNSLRAGFEPSVGLLPFWAQPILPSLDGTRQVRFETRSSFFRHQQSI